jgi:hypothetical protein
VGTVNGQQSTGILVKKEIIACIFFSVTSKLKGTGAFK